MATYRTSSGFREHLSTTASELSDGSRSLDVAGAAPDRSENSQDGHAPFPCAASAEAREPPCPRQSGRSALLALSTSCDNGPAWMDQSARSPMRCWENLGWGSLGWPRQPPAAGSACAPSYANPPVGAKGSFVVPAAGTLRRGCEHRLGGRSTGRHCSRRSSLLCRSSTCVA
jgi:hypothetical protein